MASDAFCFLSLFLSRYPQYASAPFHIAAESWGGHYGPHIAHFIHRMNKESDIANPLAIPKINMTSVILANGLTDPVIQFASIPAYACGSSPYPPFDPNGPECTALARNTPVCTAMIEACYEYPSNLTCSPPTSSCWRNFMGAIISTDRNSYDLRKVCDENSSICYEETIGIEKWLNAPSHKRALGVDMGRDFAMCNMTVNAAFYEHGQAMLNSAALLPELIDAGIRLVVYAGNTDFVCNYMGIEQWMRKLEHIFHPEFGKAPSRRWYTIKSGLLGGEVRTAGQGAGNVTFVQIYDAGHMVSHDQPEAAADMIMRWIKNIPFIP
ncbi:uncharacterized protein FIBRA_03497 [Fibroporia radiculosa]|uniref:Carboxypeptidase n=1 Tax=Fibroporia radiculosa TaxID=599839 RepID=J4GNI4_9APHY|nr:uncharacterized protein FIBRA_03497 [Fibroporia radiculosa]CCM01445.1 predicted protein [Fibroporia radiculosa]